MGELKLCGYIPGAIGRVTELHATYYNEHWRFDLNFESQVAMELSEFLIRFDEAYDGFWVAILDGKIVGSVAIDGSTGSTEGARLRWFIIAPECQGRGIGKALMREALDFCKRADFSRVYLSGSMRPATYTRNADSLFARNTRIINGEIRSPIRCSNWSSEGTVNLTGCVAEIA